MCEPLRYSVGLCLRDTKEDLHVILMKHIICLMLMTFDQQGIMTTAKGYNKELKYSWQRRKSIRSKMDSGILGRNEAAEINNRTAFAWPQSSSQVRLMPIDGWSHLPHKSNQGGSEQSLVTGNLANGLTIVPNLRDYKSRKDIHWTELFRMHVIKHKLQGNSTSR